MAGRRFGGISDPMAIGTLLSYHMAAQRVLYTAALTLLIAGGMAGPAVRSDDRGATEWLRGRIRKDERMSRLCLKLR
jgi:hypothetical protein